MAIKWANGPSADDLLDAETFLKLMGVSGIVKPVSATGLMYLAKDLIRTSRLDVLPSNNAGVKKYLDKIKKGDTLAPTLIIPGDLLTSRALVIAEGYHRVCASYITAEDTPVKTFALEILK